LFIDDADWSDLWDIGVYFDIVNFCSLNFSNDDTNRLKLILKKSKNSDLKEHVIEHGVHNILVHVNDCSIAKNKHEKYHCLIFNKKDQ
jgi:hypothetical protein